MSVYLLIKYLANLNDLKFEFLYSQIHKEYAQNDEEKTISLEVTQNL